MPFLSFPFYNGAFQARIDHNSKRMRIRLAPLFAETGDIHSGVAREGVGWLDGAEEKQPESPASGFMARSDSSIMLYFISQIIDDFRAPETPRSPPPTCGHLGYTSGNVTHFVPRFGTQTHAHTRVCSRLANIPGVRAGETNERIANVTACSESA